MAKLKEITADIEKALKGCTVPVMRVYKDSHLEVQVNTNNNDQGAQIRLDLVWQELRLDVFLLKPIYRVIGSRYYKLTPSQTDNIRSLLNDQFFSI